MSVKPPVHARIDAHFYCIAALDDNFVVHVLVERPYGALPAWLVPLRWLEAAAAGLHNKSGGWIQNVYVLDHIR